MKSFRRVFKYIWPQWPRLTVIVLSAMIIGLLFAFSIGTVLPLLKVMMGEEGLHGWVYRVIASDRYGVSFYVPDKIDFADPNNSDIMYHLRVTSVEELSLAADAGLEQDDWIIGAGDNLVLQGAAEGISSGKLLQVLSTAADNGEIIIQYKRLNADGQMEVKELKLSTGRKPFYADFVQGALGFVPRAQTKQNARDAVIFIILMMVAVTAIR